tara:strand:- start:1064 stop:1234 length:171 start_codon:yes stop_codon:yes gene_type:complete
MKKYKVIITKETYVEADNENDAEIQAYDNLICNDVDFDVEEVEVGDPQRKGKRGSS